jgi:ketopantoate reductase
MKTLIVGAGALGGIIGAHLLAVGASVSLATRNATSAEEIKASSLRVTGIRGDLSIEAARIIDNERIESTPQRKLFPVLQGRFAAPGKWRNRSIQ